MPGRHQVLVAVKLRVHHRGRQVSIGQAGELFTSNVTYDLGAFGLGTLHGRAAVCEAALALGRANPVGHHVTNIVITQLDDRATRVQSKGIGIKADGTRRSRL
jgi:hypothetical protein